MKMFKKIINWFDDLANVYRQTKQDKEYNKRFLEIIREETSDRDSKFTKMGLKLGDDGESLIKVVRVPENFQELGDDYMIMDNLNENTAFVTNFLQREAGFLQYIGYPDYFHIEDPTSDSISLTYLAVWRFNPMIDSATKMKYFGWTIGISVAVIGSLTTALIFLI